MKMKIMWDRWRSEHARAGWRPALAAVALLAAAALASGCDGCFGDGCSARASPVGPTPVVVVPAADGGCAHAVVEASTVNCGGGDQSASAGGAPAPPDGDAPASGAPVPAPDGRAVVLRVAAASPAALAACDDDDYTFVDLTVAALRAEYGARWGYNCTRGDCMDVGSDVVSWYRGADLSRARGSPDVEVFDVVAGCGGESETAGWSRVQTGPFAWRWPRGG